MIDQALLKKNVFVFIGVILIIALYFYKDARYSTIFPRCIFNSLTGLYCPGCGSQRAFSALLHGEWKQAANYNFLFILCIPLLSYSTLIAVINIFRKEKLVLHLFYSSVFVKIFLSFVIFFWIARNVPLYPFNLLAPHTIN